MKRKIELLAPGGDIDSIKAAILAGADAIYCGLDRFNARNSAENINFDNLKGILKYAHNNNCEIFLTLNIIILENEIPSIISLLNKLVNTTIDGIIVQDLGLFYLISKHFNKLKIHASTQLTTHNDGQVYFLNKLNATRLNLSRELNLNEIKALTTIAHKNNIFTEVFIHGSNCISFSGICYMSSVHSGNSGNRGRCSQPCRDKYETTDAGKDFPLNLKDNSAYFDVKEIADAGVDSLKIEGRIKKYDYVYTVVDTWKKQLDNFYNNNKISNDNSNLFKVFNRNFSNSFLKGDIHKDMFIDNPRDYSITHLSEKTSFTSDEEQEKAELALYDEKDKIKIHVANEINKIKLAKTPLIINVSGECGKPLKLDIQTPETSFTIISELNLTDKGAEPLSYEMLLKRLKVVNETEYFIDKIDFKSLQPAVYLPFNELTSIKKKLLFILNDSEYTIAPIEIDVLIRPDKNHIKPRLAVLISSPDDVFLLNNSDSDLFFQLPDSFKNNVDEILSLFKENKKLIPYFSSVLIDEDYKAAITFLNKLQPRLIVTNNNGIAYEAFKNGIAWIAGPCLSIVNSYSLICLKEIFNCSGAFISNEISKTQIQRIVKPTDFDLYYSIFHPIVMMTSRQCLFHQVSGCEKYNVDNSCIETCEKYSSLTNFKKQTSIIEKSKGNYHRIFHETHFLNTDIITDIPDFFTGFMIDLRDIKTKTILELNKMEISMLFENHINGFANAKEEINKIIFPTTNKQYTTGI